MLVRLKLHFYGGRRGFKNNLSSYFKIVSIHVQLCGLLGKVTSWSVSPVMNSSGYGILGVNIFKMCLISLLCYLGLN